MEPDKNAPSDGGTDDKSASGQQAPADALSRTPDDLADEEAKTVAAEGPKPADGPPEKKISPIKKLFRKVNLYLLIFLLLVSIAAVVTAVNFLNSQKPAPEPNIASQSLSQDALKQLANTDATVGNSSQTLTIQGNAVIAGQTLARGNLNVAGNIQAGGSLTAASLTISGTSNLGTAQINSLQVAQNLAVQGNVTTKDLNVAGTSTFSGPMTASQITVTRLILSGNATLQVPNHIAFTGPSPNRSSINGSVLGNGGTATIGGSDTTGTINASSGNNPGTGCFISVTFAQAFTSQPHVIISPIGAAAGATNYYATRSTTGFSVCFNNAPPANQAFSFDYFVTN